MRALCTAIVMAAALISHLASAGPQPPVMINCNEVTTVPGGVASLQVSLLREGEALVAGTQNDLRYDSFFSIDANSDCTINPDIGPDSSFGKQLFASNPPDVPNSTRALIVALDNDTIIPPGLLYTCTLHVESSTPEGRYEIDNVNLIASSPTGDRIPVSGENCVVNVATPTPTGCRNNDDCPSGQVCVNGNCVTPTPTGCRSNEDCPSGQVCVNGNCLTPTPTPTPIGFCNDDRDCPEGEVCVDHHCVTPTPSPTPIGFCNDDRDCPSGEVCVDHHCVTPTPSPTPIGFCNDDRDCPSGEVCVDHHCVTLTPTPIGFCNDNRDCPAGEVCVDNHCVTATPTPRCRTNADCPSNQVCINGDCVPATPTRTPTASPTVTKRKGGGGGCNCEIDPGVPVSRAEDVLAVLLPAVVLLLRWRSRRVPR